MYLYSVCPVVEKANASDSIEDWIIAIINHVVGGHWRQTVSLKREKAIRKPDKSVGIVLLPFSKGSGSLSERFCYRYGWVFTLSFQGKKGKL